MPAPAPGGSSPTLLEDSEHLFYSHLISTNSHHLCLLSDCFDISLSLLLFCCSSWRCTNNVPLEGCSSPEPLPPPTGTQTLAIWRLALSRQSQKKADAWHRLAHHNELVQAFPCRCHKGPRRPLAVPGASALDFRLCFLDSPSSCCHCNQKGGLARSLLLSCPVSLVLICAHFLNECLHHLCELCRLTGVLRLISFFEYS